MTELLIQSAIQATRIVVPVIIVLSVVSNSLNILILSRPNLIHHACSLYFLGLAIVNLFYSSVIMTINLLADGYLLNLSLHSAFFCKLLSYIVNLCPYLSLYLIVLASVDRYCASSVHAHIRRFNSVRVARWAIGLLVIILMAYMSWAFAVFDLQRIRILQCTIRADLLSGQIFLFILIIFYVIIAPFLMILFGFLTIRNIQKTRLNTDRASNYRRTEGQLSRMLLLQVSVHIILTLPFCIMLFMLVLPISQGTTIEFYYIHVIFKLPFYLSFTTAFFLYIISAQLYRNEFIRLVQKLIPPRRVNAIHTVATMSVVTQRVQK